MYGRTCVCISLSLCCSLSLSLFSSSSSSDEFFFFWPRRYLDVGSRRFVKVEEEGTRREEAGEKDLSLMMPKRVGGKGRPQTNDTHTLQFGIHSPSSFLITSVNALSSTREEREKGPENFSTEVTPLWEITPRAPQKSTSPLLPVFGPVRPRSSLFFHPAGVSPSSSVVHSTSHRTGSGERTKNPRRRLIRCAHFSLFCQEPVLHTYEHTHTHTANLQRLLLLLLLSAHVLKHTARASHGARTTQGEYSKASKTFTPSFGPGFMCGCCCAEEGCAS